MTENDIRTLTKDSNEDYYLSAFKNIEAGKYTWNWAAFLGGEYWLNYRKMYMFGSFYFLFSLSVIFATLFAIGISCESFGFNITKTTLPGVSIVILMFCAFRCFLGAFGNNIYYRKVKKNITKGHHLCDKYNPISPFMLFFSYNIAVNPFVAFITWIRDKILLHKVLKSKSSFDNSFCEENVRSVISQKSESYYVKEFKEIELGKVISVNWAAFFAGGFWFLYRKMYLYGIVFLIINLACCLIVFGDSSTLIEQNRDSFLLLIYSSQFWIKSFCVWLLNFILLFGGANHLYYRFCLKELSQNNMAVN